MTTEQDETLATEGVDAMGAEFRAAIQRLRAMIDEVLWKVAEAFRAVGESLWGALTSDGGEWIASIAKAYAYARGQRRKKPRGRMAKQRSREAWAVLTQMRPKEVRR